MRTIEYLSPSAPVSMADQWFDVSSTGHFWVQRRFNVFQRLAGSLLMGSHDIAEIGCGHGLVQRQIEEAYGREVTGFDLNEFALQRSQSQRSRVCCYDVFQRAPELWQRFDLMLLFDVLEHIDDEDGFLQAVMFHLAPGGYLVVNVPAGQWLFSLYDRVAGHKRRYSIGTLGNVLQRNQYSVVEWSYWGFPLIPLAVARKLWLAMRRDKQDTISAGFDSRSDSMNQLLGRLSRCEQIPQKVIGASLMTVCRAPGAPVIG